MTDVGSSPITPRIFVTATDTEVGKTHLTIAIANYAIDQRVPVVVYKPTQSGEPDLPADTDHYDKLIPTSHLAHKPTCQLKYDRPIAPGLADRAANFTHTEPPRLSIHPIAQAAAHLELACTNHDAGIAIIEGAGGFHVPMPGGTWQWQWIARLATTTIIAIRPGLGTINHTLLTIDGLRAHGLHILGFVVVDRTNDHDPEDVATNVHTICKARDVPYLGTLPFHLPDQRPAHDWIQHRLWPAITRLNPSPPQATSSNIQHTDE